MGKKICIVNNDNKFEAVYYDDHNCPLNMVLIMPDGKTWENEYLLINTDVYISWHDYFNYKGYMVLKATYKNKVIFEKQKISNIQIVIDTLNRFNNISLNELEQFENIDIGFTNDIKTFFDYFKNDYLLERKSNLAFQEEISLNLTDGVLKQIDKILST